MVGERDRPLGGRVVRRQAGWRVVYGKPAVHGFSLGATSHAHSLLGLPRGSAGWVCRASSSEVTCVWTGKHVSRTGIKTAAKERHSLEADLSTMNRYQEDNDPEVLCKTTGNYSHTH